MVDQRRDAYLGLVAAGWVLVFTIPVGALPIAFLLLERRMGHAIGMLTVLFLEIFLAVLFVVLARAQVSAA